MNENKKRRILASFINLSLEELKKAEKKFNSFNSYHEGYAVILEELDELWEEIKKQNPDKDKLKNELKQIIAMGYRFYNDLLSEEE